MFLTWRLPAHSSVLATLLATSALPQVPDKAGSPAPLGPPAVFNPAMKTRLRPIKSPIDPPSLPARPLLLPEHLGDQATEVPFGERFEMEVPRNFDAGSFTLQVPFEGQTLTLALSKHSNRAAGFQILEQRADGSYAELPLNEVRTFRGYVAEDKQARVSGALLDSGLEARVLLSDGRTIGIEPDLESFRAGNRNIYLAYDVRDLPLDTFQFCTNEKVHEIHSLGGGSTDGVGCGSDSCRTELALDLDTAWYADYGNDSLLATDAAENVINHANVVYERDVDITHVITTIILRTSTASEPPGYGTATGTGDMLVAFKDDWNANHGGVVRDIAHLMTGRFTSGTAYVGVVCNSGFGYGVSGTAFSAYLRCMSNVVMHEIGHNWDAGHCTCSSPPYIMNASYPPCPHRFNPTLTVPDILAHRNAAGCLEGTTNGDRWQDARTICAGDTQFVSTSSSTNDIPIAPSCGFSDSSPDVWLSYTPGSNGSATVTTVNAGTSYDTVLGIYTGNGSFTEVACNDDFTGLQSQITWSVTAGERYLIRVSGYFGASGTAQVDLTGPACGAPFNDAWTDALDIGPGFYYGSTSGATNDGTSSCGVSSTTPDVWFLYTPYEASPVRIDTNASFYDTMLSVHDLTMANPNTASAEVICNDDYFGLQSQVEFTPVAGRSYLIRVAGYNGNTGSFRMAISGPDSANELCSAARPLEANKTHYIATEGMHVVDGDAPCGPFQDEPDRWYSYTATSDVTLAVSTCGTHDWTGVDTGLDTVLSLHSGCPGTPGNSLACNDDDGVHCTQAGLIRDSYVETPMSAGQTVRIRVSRYSPYQGRRPIQLHVDVRPGNDNCSAAITLGTGVFNGTLVGATNDGSATCGVSALSPDVWYHHVASCNGTLSVSTCGTHDGPGVDLGIDTVLSVHSSACGPELACDDDDFPLTACAGLDAGIVRDSAVQVPVTLGQNVWIRVANYNSGPTGPFTLRISCTPSGPTAYCAPANANSVNAGGAILSSAGGYGTAGATFDLTFIPTQPGLLYGGTAQINLPFGCGRRCVGGTTVRGTPFSPGSTSVSGIPYAMGVPGLNFVQYWFRDPAYFATCGSAFNLSNALMP